ncbi:ABC-type multidrug transport system, ATPase component [Halovivax ruber XH-70]|uniref:ABC-type multidrug transport system, ATPase component n=1 Tax=Halovivax ruber (strain DSM 18193 / JCM 13892 / XH-70) TaxID=797302 RepID=L0IDB4_HALRX|nr:ABC transporter ATP-binding protein [Halovivax ruber]AGB17550.1 ABC-type multidrug transport system, ATPase component [Halovivax ruber XH-70]
MKGNTSDTPRQPAPNASDGERRTDRARPPILEAESLSFAYGDVEILSNLSLSVDAATVTALIGPNGTGKTTLLRTLAGLEEPTAGAVHYHGPDVPREIGYLPQQPAFRPGFTVAETLSFYGSLVGESRADVLARLDRVGLGDAADRRVEALSGGMTRLAGIAQATIGDPPVVVLDEPGSGLDPGMSRRIYDVAREIAADGTAVLVTSHDMELVERSADVVAVLADGGVAASGHPTTLADRFDVDSLLDVYEAAVSGDHSRVRVRGETA